MLSRHSTESDQLYPRGEAETTGATERMFWRRHGLWMVPAVFEKTIRSDTLTNRRGIYFSNNLLNSKDMVKVKNYFKKQNQKCIKKDKPLYIFDLSRVSSKYIGETEKNLDRIFQRVKKMD